MEESFKKLNWYLRRLQSMSLGEILHRLREKQVVLEDRRGGEIDFQPEWNLGIAFDHFQKSQFFPTGLGSKENQWPEMFTMNRLATITNAEKLLDHEITLFHTQCKLSNPINWHQDPRTGHMWPRIFYAEVDTRDGRSVGGVKWVWELNRHHHLVTLGKAFYLTGEERYAQEVATQLQNWIVDNPPFIGVNWTSALELSLRLINWTWALHFIKQSPVFTETFFAQVMQSLSQQASYIARHLSAYSSANNHLIGEAAGLAVVGLCYSWLPEAEKWRKTGLAILERELPKQIYADGGTVEQAVAYLAFVLDFNLLVWWLAESKGYPVPPVWFERLESACDFLRHLLDECGQIPAIGDDDDAWVVRLDDRPEVNNYVSLLHTAAFLTRQPEFKIGRWDEKNHWLWGEDGRATYEALSNQATKPTTHLFSHSGYAVLRDKANIITFDWGSLGYLATAAHGHADALSLTWRVDGKPFLVDSGTYAYQEGYEWRDYFRSTRAHNTVVINGRNQSEMQGAFLWGKRATSRLLHWQTSAEFDWIVAEHDGYKDLGIRHQRSLLFVKPHWLLVVDDVIGDGEPHIEQLWHLPPHSQLTEMSNAVDISLADTRVQMVWLNEAKGNISILQGQQSPLMGWHSAHYGYVAPAPVVSYTVQHELPQRLMMLCCLVPTEPAQIVAIQTQFEQLLVDNT